MAGMAALPLQQLIASFDKSTLPKILQVCSGVYFQGSVYEISGSEVSFSTGDLIKVINIELLSVSCKDVGNNDVFELPINHTGLFKVVPEEMPYSTLEEMLSLRPVGLDSCLPFTFSIRSKISVGGFTLGAGSVLTVLSVERQPGEEDGVRCHVRGQQDVSAEVCLPISSHGEFRECESEECFTVRDIMSSPCLCSRRFRFVSTTKSQRALVLSPIYQVHAVMNLRKNIFKFPSSLEVDVVDVTEACGDVEFVTPLSLPEVLSQPEECFPAVIEILEAPDTHSMLRCSWLPELSKDSHVIFHKIGTSAMVLLSSSKGRKTQQYFLVSQQYAGRFRRRPREFDSAYELYVASMQSPGLKVSVTRSCEEDEEEGLPGLSVGDLLEVVRCDAVQLARGGRGQNQAVEALLCRRLQEPDDDDEDEEDEEDEQQQDGMEEILLPLFMRGHFVEVIADNKKYKLKDLCKQFSLPLDVKVVSRDAQLEADPLVGFASLRIEGAMSEPTIQASFPNRPDRCFEMPTQWLSMSVSFTRLALPWAGGHTPECRVERVIEVTDTFLYEFRKQGGEDAPPPPRPPKRNLSTSASSSSKKSSKKTSEEGKSRRPDKGAPTEEMASLTVNRRRPAPLAPGILDDQPPPVGPRKPPAAKVTSAKARPNTYVKMDQSKKKEEVAQITADEDSDHDYETLDESFATVVKKANENVCFY
ncbi:protein THEMIS2 isoform X2 [Pungitius pungitius]